MVSKLSLSYHSNNLLLSESPLSPSSDTSLSKLSKDTNWPCFVIHLSQYFRDCEVPDVGTADGKCSTEKGSQEKLNEAFNSIIAQTTKEEFLRRIRMQLIVDVAKKLGMDGIFVASSGTRLAGQLISDVAQGKGNQIHLETVRLIPSSDSLIKTLCEGFL